ncbi:MAG TPA: type II toxin-antitoxin system PemK/MazF family toxin [Methylomusa anaerophila]|uniref:mRNA interferase n=1 Tax=Methylomusa anaerophila TaxID=1930071 RepID=A0A348AKK6_9FIRM|nr:type II toxin-antitoxin system PemK/MazF family toxin [Methylomusa anaerophila]BBB91604.1 mRNA interferase MazF [Methylomusa anaerophila]HML89458.1 type II toxin-antitoxin system PemK/MazF family toxin [Methylomusa anaerophila]
MKIDQYSVYWVDLNPTRGAEMNKTRPCVVISPLEMNTYLRTIIIAPVTRRGREGYPTRIKLAVNDVSGWIVLDQIRAIDKTRLCEKIGNLTNGEIAEAKNIIKEMLVD